MVDQYKLLSEFKNLGELSEKLKTFSYRVLKEDCLDLPPKTFIKRSCTLTPEQKKIYEQMKKAAMAVLNGKVTTTMTVLTQVNEITSNNLWSLYVADDGTTQAVRKQQTQRANECFR